MALDTAWWDNYVRGWDAQRILNFASTLNPHSPNSAQEYLRNMAGSMQQQNAAVAAAAAAPRAQPMKAMAPQTAQAAQMPLLGGVASAGKRRAGTLLTSMGGLVDMASTIKKTLLGG
jgi:hypothetical protein